MVFIAVWKLSTVKSKAARFTLSRTIDRTNVVDASLAGCFWVSTLQVIRPRTQSVVFFAVIAQGPSRTCPAGHAFIIHVLEMMQS